MAYKLAGYGNWWIGVNDRETEGSYVFESSGELIPFTPKFYWGYGSRGTSVNCILYSPPSSGHASDILHWLDYACTTSEKSICENST